MHRRALLATLTSLALVGCSADDGTPDVPTTTEPTTEPTTTTETTAPTTTTTETTTTAEPTTTETTTETTTTLSLAMVKDRAVPFDYDEFFRNAESHIRDWVHLDRGEIVQVGGPSDDDVFTFRVNTTRENGLWDDDVFVVWRGDRFLEDDIVEVWGQYGGVVSYETALGTERSIPSIYAFEMVLLESE